MDNFSDFENELESLSLAASSSTARTLFDELRDMHITDFEKARELGDELYESYESHEEWDEYEQGYSEYRYIFLGSIFSFDDEDVPTVLQAVVEKVKMATEEKEELLREKAEELRELKETYEMLEKELTVEQIDNDDADNNMAATSSMKDATTTTKTMLPIR
ncbi:12620_t:CDS:2 [Ambispora leptoticha]|uniref:12620_t:CDS:1 n=1 Tax=Ambispora leptoticha TaxID=144679 RepID=A0A9N9ABF0_9GLOM|nr:12620_t:CDS:2 [Ambispora leptoticha]